MKSVLSSPGIKPQTFRSRLLEWYDRHRRVLPWRADLRHNLGQFTGQEPDPYHIWLSEIMLQQTVVAAVIPYFVKFVDKWPSVHDLAQAPPEEVMDAWAGLGYYARARNLHKCAQIISADYNGIFPGTEADLKKLPGIGDYTSAAIAAIAFNRPAVVVDGNIERVMARYFAVTQPLPESKKALKEYAASMAPSMSAGRPGDYAQALMDLGATICIPKAPRCGLCPVAEGCLARRLGIAADLPAKKVKQPKPQKEGFIYWIEDGQGHVLLERRPENGMLGGMNGFPSSEWSDKADVISASHDQGLLKYLGTSCSHRINPDYFIRHSFTHFDLKLYGVFAKIRPVKPEQPYFWQKIDDLHDVKFPTLFKKFVKLVPHHV